MPSSRRGFTIGAGILLAAVTAGLFFAGAFCQWAEGWEADGSNPCSWWFVGGAVSLVGTVAAFALARRR